MVDINNNKKILIFIPAYNVEKKIINVLQRIPENIFDNFFIRILIVEDCSVDKTKFVIDEYINSKSDGLIHLIKNEKNHGYGGVQKIAFKYAIDMKFDYSIMLHGDGQYAPEKIPEFISCLIETNADAVFGSRFINPKDALKGNMPLYKFVGNKALTFVQNLLIGSKMSEFHSGYRAFKIKSLESINFEKNTNNFHFDTEIIIQMLKKNNIIKEIAIPTHYGDEVSHLRSIPYGISVLISTIKYKFLQKD